ncbi:transporter substrate-binding domain-containing protein [Candidatus Bipolaricaulota bacterium]|nr:transporter substrate-binding domain-containing protein [Candidatus Bipolaricaulota bacterium]
MNGTCVNLVADPYPPYQFREDDTIMGIDYETVSRIFHAMQMDLHVDLCPWDECLHRVDVGDADGVFQITKTRARESRFLFSDLLREEETALFSKRPLPPTSSLCEILPNGRHLLGVLEGYSYNDEIDRLPAESKLVVPDQEALLDALCQGRCHAILMDAGVADYLCAKQRITGLHKADGFGVRRELYVAFNRNRVEIQHTFNQGLHHWRGSSQPRARN